MCNSIAMTKHRKYRVLVSWLPISEDGWFATIDSKPRSGVFDCLMNHLSRALAWKDRQKQLRLRIDTIQVPVITDLILLVRSRNSLLLLCSVRPLLIKLQSLRLNVTNQLVVNAEGCATGHTHQSRDGIFSNPAEISGGNNSTTTIEMLNDRGSFRFSYFAVE